jgi:hypothetical protein
LSDANVEYVKEILLARNEKPCEKCGHCPTCGRVNAAPRYPYYPWTVPYPISQPYWWTTSSGTSANPPGGITYSA